MAILFYCIFAYMNPFSLSLLSRCSLTKGPSFWKNGCLSGLAMVPAPLVLAYWSHSFDALSDTGGGGQKVNVLLIVQIVYLEMESTL